ncbi:transposase [Haloglycomyces albus]
MLTPTGSGDPVTRDRRALLNGIAYRVKSGGPWHYIPAIYGPWQTIY